MSGTTHLSDRVATLETEVATLKQQHQADDTTIQGLQTQMDQVQQQLAAVQQQLDAPKPQAGTPGLQDTAGDLAALDAWLQAQTGVSLEYQLQRMCAQFYGNPLMPPS